MTLFRHVGSQLCSIEQRDTRERVRPLRNCRLRTHKNERCDKYAGKLTSPHHATTSRTRFRNGRCACALERRRPPYMAQACLVSLWDQHIA